MSLSFLFCPVILVLLVIILNVRATTVYCNGGKAELQANRNKEAEDEGREEVLSRIQKGLLTIIEGKISQPACFTYVSYTTNDG